MEDSKNATRNTVTPERDAGLEALRTEAAVVDRPGRAILRLTGKDPLGMLNAVLTNDVPQAPDLGSYALLLSPKGRIQADLRVLKAGKALLLETGPEGAGAVREILGRYAPFSRVRIEDLSETWSVLGLYGPRAREALGGPELAEHQTAEVEVGDATLLAAGVAVPVPGFDLFGSAEAVAGASERLVERGVSPATGDAYETARVGAGVPRFGQDMTPDNFPGEAGVLDRAVSFRKGCYPGQETVARMRYRGHPNKTLHRLAVEGEPPAAQTPILQEGKRVGMLTSVAPLPVGGEAIALGYLSRNADLRGPLRAGEASVRVLERA